MRIVFVTGCLESGRSGVGDYVQRLAWACSRHGCETLMLAVNDPFIEKDVSFEGNPSSFRLGSRAYEGNGILNILPSIDRFSPDWISLQFVPYSFDSRGLVARKSGQLLQLQSGRPLQVMCHELWVGEEAGAGWKRKVNGVLQKIMIKRFFKAAQPRVLHTSSSVYQGMLAEAGFHAEVLPMFSTIPDVGRNCRNELLAELDASGPKIADSGSDEHYWLAGLFGTLHPSVRYETVFEGLIRAAADLRRIPVCISFGQLGPGEAIWRSLHEAFGDRIRFLALGALPAEKVSQVLNALDVGIGTTPWDLVSKSSTAAAMLEHGLPVLTADEVDRHRVRAKSFSEGVISIDAYLAAGWHFKKHAFPKYDGLSQVTEQFLRSLQESDSRSGAGAQERRRQPVAL